MTATIEDEVRTMLARRAADVPDDGAGPVDMPTGLRIPVDDRPLDGGRLRRLAIAAAAVVLVLGAVGLVVGTADDDTRERTGPAEEPVRPEGPVPPIEGLPQGITGADLLPVWTDTADADADALTAGRRDAGIAFGRYTQARLARGTGSSIRIRDIAGFPGWARARVTWQVGEDGGSTDEAVAHLWWTGERWAVMAVLSVVHDLTGLEVDRERAAGSIYGHGDRRGLGLGARAPGLRIDRWTDDLPVVGESPGGDVAIVVDAPLPDGPTTLLVAPTEASGDPPPSFSELAFDPAGLPSAGPETPPTIGGGGQPLPGTEPVGISVDAPVARAVEALLPAGVELVAAEHRTSDDGEMDEVSFSSVVGGTGWEVTVFRRFDSDEYESMEVPEAELPWGRAWVSGSADRTGATVLSDGGLAVRVANLDPAGPVPHEDVFAVADALVADPTVVAVAQGADPSG